MGGAIQSGISFVVDTVNLFKGNITPMDYGLQAGTDLGLTGANMAQGLAGGPVDWAMEAFSAAKLANSSYHMIVD